MKVLCLLTITALVCAVTNGLVEPFHGKLNNQKIGVRDDMYHGKCSSDSRAHWFLNATTYDLEFTYMGESGGYLDRSCLEEIDDSEYSFTITVKEGFSTIGEYAFSRFKNLFYVSLPSTLKTIEEGAFSYCGSLQGTVKIPESVETIGKSIFESSPLKSITIPERVTVIPERAFYNCQDLQTLEILGPVTSIEDNAFSGCNNLQSVTLPKTVESIGKFAFYNCYSLTEMAIPKSVTNISDFAFKGCKTVTGFSVDSENQVYKSDDKGVLFNRNCSTLLVYPSGREGDYVIPDGVETIVEDAFFACGHISSLHIPASVKSIADGELGFLYGSSELSSIIVSLENTIFSTQNGVLFQKLQDEKLKLLRYPQAREYNAYSVPTNVIEIGFAAFSGASKTKRVIVSKGVQQIGFFAFAESDIAEIVISETVRSIVDQAFLAAGKLKEITLPESVTSIGASLFHSCKQLQSVTILSKISSIPRATFASCISLVNVTIPAGVKRIGGDAFFRCDSLTSLDIPASVESIEDGEYEFAYGCKSLAAINVDQDNSNFTSDDGVLFERLENGKLKLIKYPQAHESDTYTVPDNVLEIGFAAFRRVSNKTKSVIISNGVQVIGSYAFDHSNLLEVALPETLVSIGDYAFSWSDYITEMTIPDSVTSLGEYAFFRCSGLQSVSLSSELDKIPVGAFRECFSLGEVVIPGKVKIIQDRAFLYCTSMVSLTIPSGVQTIGTSAFELCESLPDVYIPDSVLVIGPRAFMECYALETLYISKNVRTIDELAFIFCPSIKKVVLPASVQNWGVAPFEMDTGLEEVIFEPGSTVVPFAIFYGCSGLKSVTIPDSVEMVLDYAFSFCSSLTSIVIPKNVYYIGSYAFLGDSSLSDVTIPGAEYIGEGAFSDCTGLPFVTIPSGVLALGPQCFYNCRNLRFVEIEDGLLQIDKLCFAGCSRLVNISLPSSVTHVGDSAFAECLSLEKATHSATSMDYYGTEVFEGCKNLVYATLPSEIQSIPAGLFYNCMSLKTIALPSEVTSISANAFAGCSNLTTIEFPPQLTEIGERAYSGCVSLKTLTIPASISTLGDFAFEGCSNLSRVAILPGLQSLGRNIFDGCNKLVNISIPNTVSSISDYAFAGLSGLQQINVDSDNSAFYSSGGVLYNKQGVLIRYPQGRSGAFTVPEGVLEISNNAFSGCHSLTSISLSSTVETIGPNSFDDLPALGSIKAENNDNFKSVAGVLFSKDGLALVRYPGGKKGSYSIPSTTKEVSSGAFYMCGGLTSVVIPSSVESIGVRAFGGCGGLLNVTVPGSIKVVSDYSFSGCTKLKAVTLSTGVTTIGSYAFDGCSALESVLIRNGVTFIGSYAFHGCGRFANIMIPAGVETIDSYAFSGCNPTSVRIPASVSSIGDNIFDECYNLVAIEVDEHNERYASSNGVLMDTVKRALVQFPKAYKGDFYIPETVAAIDGKTFVGCSGLTGVVIPKTVMQIDIKPFAGCINLKSITVDGENEKYMDIGGVLYELETMTLIDFPEGLGGVYVVPDGTQVIAQSAFQGNTHLTGVTIPHGVLYINDYAFEGCASLTSAEISSTVSSIGDYAFAGCLSLETLDYRGLKNPCDKAKNHTFEGCVNLRAVCISNKYDQDDYTFCGTRDVCFGDSVEALGLKSTACREEVCVGGLISWRSKHNATQWRNKTNACVDFECDAVIGRVQWSMCNATKTLNFMCMNGGCVPRDQPIVVEIEMGNIQAGDFDDDSMMLELQECTGVETFSVGYELGDNALVLRVVVVIDNVEAGETIVNAVNNLKKDDTCPYRTLCLSKKAILIINTQDLSRARMNHVELFMVIIALLGVMVSFFS